MMSNPVPTGMSGTGRLVDACLAALAQTSLTRPFARVRRVQGQAIEAMGPDLPIGALCRIVPRHLSANSTGDIGGNGGMAGLSRASRCGPIRGTGTGASAGAGAGAGADTTGMLAEVVAARPGHVTLMAYGQLHGIAAGDEILILAQDEHGTGIAVGDALLGRVLDCFGNPLDGRPLPAGLIRQPLHMPADNPLQRPVIDTVLETGVRCIDALLTLGRGQRVGIFSGSGVGKSTLLAMIARHAGASTRGAGSTDTGTPAACSGTGTSASASATDVAGNAGTAARMKKGSRDSIDAHYDATTVQGPDLNVIALIGERGREVRDFIERQLGSDGMSRSIVIVATADQPAMARVRAAHAAVAVASHFRQQGRHVLLTMDSVTRLAMARREIGLAAGEPATARGYTPSVFSEITGLCERCGTAASGGAITALLTVLVEGDDFNEPVSDCLRAVLDGHIVLTRTLAHQSFFPAIDVLQSASRLLRELAAPAEVALAGEALRHLALLERNRAMIDIGAHEAGVNAALDLALELEPALRAWQRQQQGGVPRRQALDELAALLRLTGEPT